MLYTHAIEEGSARTHLMDRVTTQLHSRASDLVIAKGDSDETGLRIGDVVSIQEPAFSLTGNLSDGLQEQNFGSYILTDITHVCDESGSYHNSFQAVPQDVLAPPYGNVHNHPVADTQTATVTDNNDPAGLGRVQVKFAWQEEHTPWIRMANPHAGSGKGMYFIPEKGEEVLVAFEAGNAEKPFVLGSMYNGNEVSGFVTPNNEKKVIQTRSGANILFDDDKGSITITDKSGSNTIVLDGTDTITITSSSNIAVNSDNITISGKSSVSIESKVVSINGSDSVYINSEKASLSLASSGGKATLSGIDSMMDGTNTSTVKGNSKTTIDATGQTVITGAVVKLN